MFRALGLVLACLAATSVQAETIEGRVSHPNSERKLEGIPVRLFVANEGNTFSTTDTATGADGSFRFEDVDRAKAYGVYAEYEDVTFPAKLVTFEKTVGDAASVELPIFDVVREPAETAASEIEFTVGQLVVDRGEAGAYQVRHLLELENPRDVVIVADKSAKPLFEVGLLPNYDEVAAILSAGVDYSPTNFEVEGNAAQFFGPIFPGPQRIEVAYDVDAGGRTLDTRLEFKSDLPVFRLIVPDRRQAVYADGLYTARGDGRYQFFLDFDIAAGSTVDLRVEEIPEPDDSGIVGAAGLAILLFGLSVFVGLPVANEMRGAAQAPEPDRPASPSDALAMALEDLEHDFEMGKISAEDRDKLRDEVRREAVLEMARQREAEARAKAPPAHGSPGTTAVAAFCPACGGSTAKQDRFCRSCGTKL